MSSKLVEKVKLPHCLINRYATEAYGGVEIQLHVGLFLISTLAGDEWPASFPGRFTPEKKIPDTHRTQRESGPQNGPGGQQVRL
jgi:hypothetical protein